MKQILLAPDSFKGTMTAAEICAIQTEVIHRHMPHVRVDQIPMADGGEGIIDACLRLCGGERVTMRVTGPLHTPVDSFYAVLPDGSAVIEMAAAAGLPLVGQQKDPLRATTYGVGELICDAVKHGAGRILLGLGGSATNDCGIGMAAALGYCFLDAEGNKVAPLAQNMSHIAAIEPPEHLLPVEIVAACDVDNPLCGPMGATATFGAQKGVTSALMPVLEAGMCHMATLMNKCEEISTARGAGAAGGMGAAVLFFLKGALKPGIELLLDKAGFDERLEHANLVITGEGCMDDQSAHGKVPAGVGLRCKQKGVPCLAVCGSLGEGAEALYDYGISAMFSTIRGFTDLAGVERSCQEDMRLMTDTLMRLICGAEAWGAGGKTR